MFVCCVGESCDKLKGRGGIQGSKVRGQVKSALCWVVFAVCKTFFFNIFNFNCSVVSAPWLQPALQHSKELAHTLSADALIRQPQRDLEKKKISNSRRIQRPVDSLPPRLGSALAVSVSAFIYEAKTQFNDTSGLPIRSQRSSSSIPAVREKNKTTAPTPQLRFRDRGGNKSSVNTVGICLPDRFLRRSRCVYTR